jgi:hypothetical protein
MLRKSRRTIKRPVMRVCRFGDFNDDTPTDIGGAGGLFSNEDETRFPNQGGGGSGRMEDENEEVTRLKVSDGYQDFTDKTEIEFPETGALGLLWVKEGRRKGNIYQIRDEDIVGRQSPHCRAEMILDDPKVSNPHARFRVENQKFVLWDCGSRNGTYVNGTRIRNATVLKENDLIKIGETVFVIKTMH